MSTGNEMCLAWLADELHRLRLKGRTKVVGYLEAVLEEVVFETEIVPGACPRYATYLTEGV